MVIWLILLFFSLAFAEGRIAALEENPELLWNLFFSDEAHFYLNGEVNRQDFRLWSDENPHWFAEEPLHPEKVLGWCKILFGFAGKYIFTWLFLMFLSSSESSSSCASIDI